MAMLRRFCDGLAYITGAISIAALAIMTVSIIANVFFRYFMNSPLAWPPELARFLMVAITMFASGLALRRGAHVGVTVLVSLLPVRLQLVVFMINSVLIAGFLAILLWQGYILAFHEGPRQSAPSLGISMMFAFIPLPLGAALMLVYLAEATADAWQKARGGRSPFDPIQGLEDEMDQDDPGSPSPMKMGGDR
jgi:TRAP-type C4-dicarboxylate transport system permease small subunit